MKFALVTTTINYPLLLEDYCRNFKENDHNKVEIIVIGDKKTPKKVQNYCYKLAKKFGYKVDFYDDVKQNVWLKKHPELADHILWNSIQRRNLGYLIAYERNNDIIISIDDDNYVVEEDYLGSFNNIGKITECMTVQSPTQWYNICEELSSIDNRQFYPRGFPYSKRWTDGNISFVKSEGKVVVQAGLWLGDPDIDAVTRLEKPIEVINVSERALEGICLGKQVFCPFNTQNTAVHRTVIPAWFMSPYIGRFDDIWASYIIIHIAHHLDDKIAFGRPVVKQNRNEHDLFVDLEIELFGMRNTDNFIEILRATQLQGASYLECYEEVYTSLDQYVMSKTIGHVGDAERFKLFVEGMKIWLNTMKKL